ncbi:MAG: hypothetical protein J3R72DRAFT_446313 [Linnemannia gamsii]|nr:MAG: hypothetical protein J3R72DRAFT_446311 [Linnemannia gamsii]KAK3840999.1 MAG: hypothetical protein J3R72DRAFT_446313 [Linnemannia gamsii]
MSLFSFFVLFSLFFACTAEALWCQCITNPGDPFRDIDQTYSVCASVPNAVYNSGNLIRQAHCDVGPTGSSVFISKCKGYGSDTVPNCY